MISVMLQHVVLPTKPLVTGRIEAFKIFLALMNNFMPGEAGSGGKTFVTSWIFTDVLGQGLTGRRKEEGTGGGWGAGLLRLDRA